MAFKMPDKNKEAKKDIAAHTTLDMNKEAKQDVTEGSMGMSQMDVNFVQKDKRADFRLLDWPASSSPSFAGMTADGSLQLTSLISKGDPSQKAPPHMEVDTAVPSSASSKGGASKGSLSNLFRQDHWRGLRRKKIRPDAPRLEPHRESPVPQSSDS